MTVRILCVDRYMDPGTYQPMVDVVIQIPLEAMMDQQALLGTDGRVAQAASSIGRAVLEAIGGRFSSRTEADKQ